MSATAIELPLFPLNLVLFPGTVVPLYIFEPRYCQMIQDCQQEDKPFGIVLAQSGSEHLREVPYPVGTMAQIRNLKRLEDGCYTLMAFGSQRFRIVSSHREKPYLSGLVELYDDRVEAEETFAHLTEKARVLFETYLNMVLEVRNELDVAETLPDQPEALSHFIAYFLEIDDVEKQRYLELTSTRQRLHEEITMLRREIPFLRQILYNPPSEEQSLLN